MNRDLTLSLRRQLGPTARISIAVACLSAGITASAATDATNPAPKPESVVVSSLPLPPASPSDSAGACTEAINPNGTGCMTAADDGIIEGPAYLGDAKHVLLAVQFAGAPASPGPGGIYDGPQVIAIKTDGAKFANGDAWKCLTCGVPKAARADANPASTNEHGRRVPPGSEWLSLDHPQAFPGDTKMIAGTNVVDCGPYKLVDDQCTPERIRIYPIRWNTTSDGSGPGGSMRELRLNPDGEHLMWSHMIATGADIDQHGLVGRLAFNPSPRNGLPLAPRYELEDVWVLTNATNPEFAAFREDPKAPGRLIRNPVKGAIGEARGWTRDGRSAVGMGIVESGNVDMFITDLVSGHSHRLTRAPGYADPILMSPDDKWFVVLDNRTVDRHMYYGAMQGLPPLTDELTRMVMLSARYGYRNGMRRFFQPILIDRDGDRGLYTGQQLNAGGGAPGSPSDPNWNARADPAWSPDGTNVVFWQALVNAPDCGEPNPLPCPVSTEPGGRKSRLMIAKLKDRSPQSLNLRVTTQPITVPWGTRYRPGDPMPKRYPSVPAGKFTMTGQRGGEARVEIRKDANGRISYVGANYLHYTDDGEHIIDGTETAELVKSNGSARIIWHSDLRSNGSHSMTKKTSEPGGFVLSPLGEPLEGDLVTTLDGKVYKKPLPGS
ncbi:TolB family protein [Novosphingobium sp. ZW T3_23]|uniref:TolB family protein n=1 Tax=Novosphingobium sp. ZW T3_23 TaxID=3378084 RepID=UPI003851CD8C